MRLEYSAYCNVVATLKWWFHPVFSASHGVVSDATILGWLVLLRFPGSTSQSRENFYSFSRAELALPSGPQHTDPFCETPVSVFFQSGFLETPVVAGSGLTGHVAGRG